MVKVVGFDLDNTLFDQTQFEFPVFRIIAEKTQIVYGVDKEHFFNAMCLLYLEDEKSDFFSKAMLKVSDLPLDWETFVVSTILPIYRTYVPLKMELSPMGQQLLALKKSSDCRTVLITNGRVPTQKSKLKSLGLESFFDLVLISDSYTPSERKPSPHMFEEALNYFQIKAEEMIFIGDDDLRDGACRKVNIPFFSVLSETVLDDIQEALDA